MISLPSASVSSQQLFFSTFHLLSYAVVDRDKPWLSQRHTRWTWCCLHGPVGNVRIMSSEITSRDFLSSSDLTVIILHVFYIKYAQIYDHRDFSVTQNQTISDFTGRTAATWPRVQLRSDADEHINVFQMCFFRVSRCTKRHQLCVMLMRAR